MDNITNVTCTSSGMIAIKSFVSIIIVVAAVIGNTLNILVISQYHSTRTITNYLIMNLSIFGIINGLVHIPSLSIGHYLVVVKSKKLQPRHAYYCIAIIWATYSLTAPVSFLGWGNSVYVKGEKACLLSWDRTAINGIARAMDKSNVTSTPCLLYLSHF
ncbi:hypothetical protein TrispH2_004130 [Trichoplax sp. H2]|nr:hypothetical protein TrispH2_004130 [Trichoplax sp. H2]|eukprot:RDD43462.1 hypothetical protein TrispH2_004130 [Trichoplax sp. H2]